MPLSEEQVLHVAKLARLSLTPAQVEAYRVELGAILEYVERLNALNLEGVEPMFTPLQMDATAAADDARSTLGQADLAAMAPAMDGPYVKVPKVLGGGGA